MKNKDQEVQNRRDGLYAQPRVYLSRDGEYLVMVLPGNMLVRKHVNYFKQILGIPYDRKRVPEKELKQA